MTLKIITAIPLQTQQEIRELLDSYKDKLAADHSNYAKGRQRFWLQAEADLRKENVGKVYLPGVEIPRLWNYCKKIYKQAIAYSELDYTPIADLGLVAYGEVGITWYRDASYADYPAVSINLSTKETLWGYEDCRLGYDSKHPNPTPQRKTYMLAPGAVVLFNSKNPHAVLKADKDRYSINIWSVNPKFKDYFLNWKSGTCKSL